ncbi:MAG TPA: ribosome rescue protein RqcH [Methanoregulaceae archaeon]|nr:ribosome rescue protein RqcH [Methanoregulaceae archaeon]
MATTQGMSGVDIRAAVTEWRGCIPLWVDKVYQFTPKGVVFRLNGEEHARYHLLIEAGKRAHFSSRLPSPPKMPPSFAMLLRKYLSGGKVLDIRQAGIQRIVTIDIGKRDLTYHLILELFDDGNIVLCDENFTIIKPLIHHRFKDREVVPGVVYVYPQGDPTTWSREKFGEFLKHEERDIVRTLAVGTMLGGVYAEYVCQMTGTAKETPSADVDAGMIYDALQDLISRAESGISPVISGNMCLPFPMDGNEAHTDFPGFNTALDSFYPPLSTAKREGKKTGPKLSRREYIKKQQEEAIKKFEKKIVHNEKIVEKFYENYGLVQEIITTLSDASKTRSWQEIQDILRTQKSGSALKIKAIHPAESAVDVDLGEIVTLYVQESPDANAGRYYDQIKKFRKKIIGARVAMERAVPEKSEKIHPVPIVKKRWFHRFRWFYTSDGVLVLGGRDASQNEELVKKYLEGGDRFVHADVHGASVIIVKGETRCMEEVAIFAASYSGAWRSGHFSADVYSVSPDQVSKTPESGEYVSRGSFIIRGERSYQRDVPLEIAIGLMQTPQVAVIGGPPSSITRRTKYSVIIKPGRFEPNDIAKKVLRVLKEKIPEKELKGYKKILNTEQVAAFVPPGGSDIVGDYES